MNLPVPRLRAILRGQQFTLKGEDRTRTLLETDRKYSHFKNGRASPCHELNPVNLEWAAGGWRVEIRESNVKTLQTLD